MKTLYAIAIIAALLAAGCRMADPGPQASSLRSQNLENPIEPAGVMPLSIDKSAQPANSPAALAITRLPVVHSSNVQLVANYEETSTEPPAAPELLSVPEAAGIAESELHLADLEDIALQNNPALAQATSRVEAARGNWVQVGLGPNPTLGYSGQQLGSGGVAEQQGVFIGQEFVTGRKLRLNRQSAAWEIQRTQRELEAVRLRVLTDVRIGYYEVLIAQRRRELSGELVRISTQGAEAAQALFKGEEVSEADPLRARVEADTARILLQTSTNQHVESWRRLTAVLGMPELVLQRLEGELEPGNLQLSWQDTLRRVLSESPEISAAMADVEAARWAVRRAYAEVIPNVDVQTVVQDDRSTGSTNGNLQMTLPIPIWNRNQGGIRRAQAEAAAAARAVDRIALDIQTRLATAFQRYESARNQVDKYSREGGILENAKRTLELIRTGYKADEFGVLDLLSAQRTYFQTSLAYLDSQRELWVSVMEIRGLLLRGSLQGRPIGRF